MTETSEWPDFFPPHVPPDTALPASGVAFRLVKHIPPSASDFLSTFEEYPNRTFPDDHLGKQFGVSLYRRLECTQRTRNRYKPLRDRHIAIGILKETHGVAMSTPSRGNSHLTLWKKKSSVDIHSDFTSNAEES